MAFRCFSPASCKQWLQRWTVDPVAVGNPPATESTKDCPALYLTVRESLRMSCDLGPLQVHNPGAKTHRESQEAREDVTSAKRTER